MDSRERTVGIDKRAYVLTSFEEETILSWVSWPSMIGKPAKSMLYLEQTTKNMSKLTDLGPPMARMSYLPGIRQQNGKWLVFTQAHSFMLLQPDSKLYIMPTEGGQPRLMNCNTNRMNSWHSWSPNSKWLVFSSKVFSPNTQLFLTHIDEKGNDTPPVLLRNFIPLDEERGANIPEFVNTEAGVVRMIRDGRLANDSYFSLDTVRAVYRVACLSGIDYVELGYRNSKEMLSPTEYGPWRFCDEDQLRKVMEGIKKCDTKISIMQDAHKAFPEDVIPKADSVIDIIRMATYVRDINKAIRLANNGTDNGTLYGLGRAAGNCPIEMLVSYLDNPKYTLLPLLEVIQRKLIPLRQEIEWGYHIPYMFTGILNKHPRDAMEWMNSPRKDELVEFYNLLLKK